MDNADKRVLESEKHYEKALAEILEHSSRLPDRQVKATEQP